MNKPHNIIVLVADSLRYDSVHAPGRRSPLLGGPLNNGLPYTSAHASRFTQARSGGCWTLPATASLFTGLMPHEHGADAQSRGLNPKVPTLAELLREQGYSTHQITANVATTEIFGLDRGFDEMKRIWDVVPAHHKKIHEALVLVGKPRLRKKILSKDFVAGKLSEDLEASKVWLQRTCDDVLNEARATIRRNQDRGKGSFLFLNLMETHFPYHIAPTFETLSEGIWGKLREIVSLYHLVNQTWLIKGESPIRQDMLELLRDRQRKAWELLAPTVDEFVRELHEGGDNLVVFGSDHGDCFGEQGWMYHFSNVADGGNRVPLYWLSPGQSEAVTVDTPVSARDLFHGVLSEAGNPAGLFHPVHDPHRSFPTMQSSWYNNQGKTLSKFKYNQICFLESGNRWLYRRGEWLAAPPATENGEDTFQPLPGGVNPLEETVIPLERRRHLQQVLADFQAFSAKHAA